tara:strand:+ start:1859 stop:2170 length:312 start_codon:yes stop_codon:yes gene_type:complete
LNNITKNQLFLNVQSSSKQFKYKNLFKIRYSQTAPLYVGFIINKKLGPAVFRNKLKRQVREHYKKMNQDMPVSIIFQALSSKINKNNLKSGFKRFVLLLGGMF